MAKKNKAQQKGSKRTSRQGENIALNPLDQGEANDERDVAGRAERTDAILAEKGKALMDRAVLFMLVKGGFQNQRSIGREIVNTEADKSMLALSKRLLDSKELRKIAAIDRQATDYVEMLALPSPFRFGVSLVPYTLVERINDRMKELATERAAAIEAFFADREGDDGAARPSIYNEAIQSAKDRLKDLFNSADYPDGSIARERFTFGWQFMEFKTPAALGKVNPAILKEELAKADAQMKSAVVEIQNALRCQLRELTAKLVERLEPGPDGKPKMILKSLGDNLSSFLDVFDFRNVTDDGELEELVQKARDLTGRVQVPILREDMDERANLAVAFEAITKNLDEMIVPVAAGQRRIKVMGVTDGAANDRSGQEVEAAAAV